MAWPILPNALATHRGRHLVVDVALAVALCVLAVGGLASGQVDERPLAVTLPIAVISTLSIGARKRLPVTVVAVVSILSIVQALLAGGSSETLWSLVVFLVATYTVGAECDEGAALIGLGLVLGTQYVGEWLDHGSDYPFDTLVFGGVWLFGRGTRSWRDQAVRAEQHQRDLARLAVAEERARIARELHDVVAHSLTVIAVQSDAAEAALPKDPDLAAAPLRAIRDSARHALADMRQLLHVLRAEDDSDPLRHPVRGVADLPHLLSEMRRSGLPVTADIQVPGDLPSGLGLTVFRVAQEALTNVRKHAGDVPTSLVITSGPAELRVEVRNEAADGPPASRTSLSTGHGLIGARERVLATGGTFGAGPTVSGGFEVTARMPLESGQP